MTTIVKKNNKKSSRKGIDGSFLLNLQYRGIEIDDTEHQTAKERNTYRKRDYIPSSFKPSMFRLVLCPSRALSSEKGLRNPDVQLPWQYVIQVLVPEDLESASQCPICLETIRVPKITECGHIYCYSCILRHLDTPSKYVPRCPVCSKSICESDLKSVSIVVNSNVKERDMTTLQLLKRGSDSLCPIALPSKSVGNFVCFDSVEVPCLKSPHAPFSRFVVASPEDIRGIFENEKKELLLFQEECLASADVAVWSDVHPMRGDVENLPYVALAMAQLLKREDQLAASSADYLWNVISSSTSSASLSATATASPSLLASASSSSIYSYQLPHGDLVFLHPLCMRCLLAAKPCDNASESDLNEERESPAVTAPSSVFVDGEHVLPLRIKAPIVEVEVQRVTKDLRKRISFLKHLPIGTEIKFIEIDLKEYVAKSILDQFSSEFRSRERLRQHHRDKLRMQKDLEEEEREAYEENVRQMRLEQEQALELLMEEFRLAPPLPQSSPAIASDELIESVKPSVDEQSKSAASSFVAVTQVPYPQQVYCCNVPQSQAMTMLQMSGYFPSLGSEPMKAAAVDGPCWKVPVAGMNFPKTPPCWSSRSPAINANNRGYLERPSTDSPSVNHVSASNSPGLPVTKKKGKGAPLFSNTATRSYRS